MAVHPELRFISVATGGGGLDLGLELAVPSARAVCYLEREAFAVEHLVLAMEAGALHQAPVWSDADAFHGRVWRGLVDGVAGGIPCQPHSIGGARLGADDERDLWPAFRRILVQCGAWWCFVENVDGILSSGGGERIWRDLLRLGFSCEIGIFTAREVGASHERSRAFFLGLHEGRALSAIDVADPGGAGSAVREDRRQDIEPAYLAPERSGARLDDGGWLPLFPPGPRDPGWPGILADLPDHQPTIRRVDDGSPEWLEQLHMLGNGAVPVQAAHAFQTLVAQAAAAGSAAAARLQALSAD